MLYCTAPRHTCARGRCQVADDKTGQALLKIIVYLVRMQKLEL